MTATAQSYRHSFQSMGTTIEVLLIGPAGLELEAIGTFVRAEGLAARWEQTFSRFRSDTEISRLNAQAGRAVPVSDLLYAAIEIAIDATRQSDGLFDPSVLPALVALGYDRTFDEIPDNGGMVMPSIVPGTDRISLDPERRFVTLPPGCQIDLGGLVKGLYADMLAGSGNWSGGVISAGGDLRVWGMPPHGNCWIVGVEDPDHPQRDVAQLRFGIGGVATSGTNRRTWCRGGKPVHHVIDPRTGLPAAGGIRSVSVLSSTAVQAEVAAKALVIGGIENQAAKRLFIHAVVVLDDGQIVTVPGTMGGDVDVIDLAAHAAIAV